MYETGRSILRIYARYIDGGGVVIPADKLLVFEQLFQHIASAPSYPSVPFDNVLLATSARILGVNFWIFNTKWNIKVNKKCIV